MAGDSGTPSEEQPQTIGAAQAKGQVLSLQIEGAGARGQAWANAALLAFAIATWQLATSWLANVSALEAPNESMGPYTQMDLLGTWWLPAVSTVLYVAGALSAILARSIWPVVPFLVAGLATGWIYNAGSSEDALSINEYASALAFISLAVALATTPIISRGARHNRVMAWMLISMFVISLWIGSVNKGDDGSGWSFDVSDIYDIDTRFLAFAGWVRLGESIVAGAAVVALTRRVHYRISKSLAFGLTATLLTTWDLWVGALAQAIELHWDTTKYLGFAAALGAGWAYTMDVRVLLPLPCAIIAGGLLILVRRGRALTPIRNLASPVTPLSLESAMRAGSKDPTLRILYWAPALQGYVNATGRSTMQPVEGAGRLVISVVTRDDKAVTAAVEHSIASDPSIVQELVNRSARALLEARERAVAQAHLIQLTESRQRLAESAFEDRRSLERDLHDGAQQRLLALSTRLARIRNSSQPEVSTEIDLALDELRAALADLRNLAQGVHPAILSQSGLRAAVESIADGLPVKVHLNIEDRRYPEVVESTLYFVIAEALTNAVKHSGSSEVEVSAVGGRGAVRLLVRDRGRGGAKLRNGTGLRNLADRFEAVGGRIEVASDLGQGTAIAGYLPYSKS